MPFVANYCFRIITYLDVTPSILFFCIAETTTALKRCADMGAWMIGLRGDAPGKGIGYPTPSPQTRTWRIPLIRFLSIQTHSALPISACITRKAPPLLAHNYATRQVTTLEMVSCSTLWFYGDTVRGICVPPMVRFREHYTWPPLPYSGSLGSHFPTFPNR